MCMRGHTQTHTPEQATTKRFKTTITNIGRAKDIYRQNKFPRGKQRNKQTNKQMADS